MLSISVASREQHSHPAPHTHLKNSSIIDQPDRLNEPLIPTCKLFRVAVLQAVVSPLIYSLTFHLPVACQWLALLRWHVRLFYFTSFSVFVFCAVACPQFELLSLPNFTSLLPLAQSSVISSGTTIKLSILNRLSLDS